MILPKESATFFKLPIQLFKGVSYPELALFVYESSDQNYFRIILPNIFKVVTIQRTRRCSRRLEKGEDCVVGRVAVLLGCLDD